MALVFVFLGRIFRSLKSLILAPLTLVIVFLSHSLLLCFISEMGLLFSAMHTTSRQGKDLCVTNQEMFPL